MSESALKTFECTVLPVPDLPAERRTEIHQLFDMSYREANHAYLDKSLEVLGYVSVARKDGAIAGFGVGKTIETDLPRLPAPQTVGLAGICCIRAEYRRLGLFGHLMQLALAASGVPREGRRVLGAGRMAHPASFHSMSQNPTVVPKLNVPITKWQQEVGLRIAELYEVQIDPETFVVQGSGKPIGYPVMEIDVPDSEWRIFNKVDRDKGDSLLAISWSPDAPPGW